MLVKFANLLIPVDKDGRRIKRGSRHTTEDELEQVDLVKGPQRRGRGNENRNPMLDIMEGVQQLGKLFGGLKDHKVKSDEL